MATLAVGHGAAQPTPAPAFTVVPLGVRGGLDESNLSAYLAAPAGSTAYVCLGMRLVCPVQGRSLAL